MVALPKWLNPAAYSRYARWRLAAWTEMRRVARNWPAWVWRDLWRPLRAVPLAVETRDGARFLLGDDPIDDRILRHVYHRAGDLYFPGGVTVGQGEVILDIGAHCGIYAVSMLRRHPGATLVAVEPNPASCRRLRLNLRANELDGRATVVQAALGPWSGTTVLEQGNGSWGDRTHPRSPQGGGVRVAMRTVTEVLDGRTPVLVKCNAEGAEFEVFPQMFAAGIRPRWVVVMTHADEGPVEELIGRFRQAGYQVEDADRPARGARFHCRLRSVPPPGTGR